VDDSSHSAQILAANEARRPRVRDTSASHETYPFCGMWNKLALWTDELAATWRKRGIMRYVDHVEAVVQLLRDYGQERPEILTATHLYYWKDRLQASPRSSASLARTLPSDRHSRLGS
jgi:hypothetical protein